MATQQLTLYAAKICPYAHRVEIALAEAKAMFTRYEINLFNKPEWYSQVNPASKVPAVTYGGPEVPADQPSPESTKIAESLILVDFVNDLYPEANLLPKDPVLRAKARLFADAVSNKLERTQYRVINLGVKEETEQLVQAFEHIQSLLPSEGFVVGEFSFADIAIGPFLARIELLLSHDLGDWPAGQDQGPKLLELLQQPKLARIWEYARDVQARPSFVATWDKDVVLKTWVPRFKEIRDKKYST